MGAFASELGKIATVLPLDVKVYIVRITRFLL